MLSAIWGEGGVMDFQHWVRALLSDAASRNEAQIVAELAPHALRTLYEQGAAPSVEGIIAKAPSEQGSR